MSSLTPSDPADVDLACVQRAQAGDLEAFDELIARHQSTVSALLYRFSRERSDLEDLVQETFVRAWRALPHWQPDKPFVHWLKRIAVNIGLEFYRKHQRSPFSRLQQPVRGDRDPLDTLAEPHSPDAARQAADEAAFILSHLPAEDRALLTLLHLQEMPLQEIAGHFGWSKVKTKVRAFRARQQLRNLLTRYGYSYT